MEREGKYLVTLAILSAVLLTGIAAAQDGGLVLEKKGDIVTISGSTNLAAGDLLQVNVVSAAFTPTEKGTGGGFSGTAGTAAVQQGSSLNSFSFDVNVSTFPPGLYLVTVESVEPRLTESTRFVLPWTPVPAEITTLPTTLPVTTPRATTVAATASPTPAPLPVILPLAAVALASFILLRRR
ncbi:MAG TPA: hypothetical protein VKO45_06770 [Methanomicrobiales archaeon]|nr:hypothetical protein [Methanomicrobiales archaeon]